MFAQPINALASIKSLAFQRIPISLISSYKGLIFDEKINPLRVGAEEVAFSAPRPYVCHTMQEPLYLHSHVLPQSVRANLQSGNPAAGEILLTNFRFTGNPWRDRLEQRVQPVLPIPAMITVNQRIYQASLQDLSVHGAGVIIHMREVEALELPAKSSVDINFQLDSQTRISMRSTVAFARKTGLSLMVLGLRLHPTPNQEVWLNDYISRRKIEIMSELQQSIRERAGSTRVGNRQR